MMIRLILILIELLIALVLLIPYGTAALIVRVFDERAAGRFFRKFVALESSIVIAMTGSSLEVSGIENIPADGGVLIVANHRSIMDILAIYATVPKELAFVAKKELKRIPVLSQMVLLLNGIFIDRKNIREGLKAILEATEKVKAGISIMIFPEGTRTKGDNVRELLPFREGSLKISKKSGAPVIPVAIIGTREILEKNLPKLKVTPSQVVIRYGKPVLLEEHEKNAGERVRGEILKLMG